MLQDMVVEIEKELGAKDDDKPGKQIGKALKCLQKLEEKQENVAMGLLQEIQNVLKADVPLDGASEVAKLFHSLKQFAKERAMDQLEKAFVEFAKNTATAYATAFNAVNIFGTTLSFVIPKGSSAKLDSDHYIRGVLIAMTLAFLPISLLTVGMSHALTHRLQWKKVVAIMLMAEVLYMTVMCILFGIYLMPATNGMAVVLCTCAGAGCSLLAVPCCVFKIPGDPKVPLAWCKTKCLDLLAWCKTKCLDLLAWCITKFLECADAAN